MQDNAMDYDVTALEQGDNDFVEIFTSTSTVTATFLEHHSSSNFLPDDLTITNSTAQGALYKFYPVHSDDTTPCGTTDNPCKPSHLGGAPKDPGFAISFNQDASSFVSAADTSWLSSTTIGFTIKWLY